MGLLSRFLLARERRLAQELDPFKKVGALEWGLDSLDLSGNPNGLEALTQYAQIQVEASDQFYAHPRLQRYELEGNHLTFESPVTTEAPANNISSWRLFESKQREKAVLVIPHWNAVDNGYDRLSALLQRSGLTVLRMCMPYHGRRNCPGSVCADGMVSANLGRTIRSSRQAVLEARMAIDWLEQCGYSNIGVIGTSLGSSIAFILAAHDRRVQAACFLLLASHFGDVVWTGTATAHIRKSLEGRMTREDLRTIWSLISPVTFARLLASRPIRIHIVSARLDAVFEPALTREIIAMLTQRGIPHSWKAMSCGHYTLGSFPFNLMAAVSTMRFFRRAFKGTTKANS